MDEWAQTRDTALCEHEPFGCGSALDDTVQVHSMICSDFIIFLLRLLSAFMFILFLSRKILFKSERMVREVYLLVSRKSISLQYLLDVN